MHRHPKIQVDSFMGDLANTLLLAPVYREPKRPLQQEVEDHLAYKEKYYPVPERKPKAKAIEVFRPHDCPKDDWEYDEHGNRVPNDTIVRCPDCNVVWVMENRHMREMTFIEQHFILPVFLRVYNRRKK